MSVAMPPSPSATSGFHNKPYYPDLNVRRSTRLHPELASPRIRQSPRRSSTSVPVITPSSKRRRSPADATPHHNTPPSAKSTKQSAAPAPKSLPVPVASSSKRKADDPPLDAELEPTPSHTSAPVSAMTRRKKRKENVVVEKVTPPSPPQLLASITVKPRVRAATNRYGTRSANSTSSHPPTDDEDAATIEAISLTLPPSPKDVDIFGEDQCTPLPTNQVIPEPIDDSTHIKVDILEVPPAATAEGTPPPLTLIPTPTPTSSYVTYTSLSPPFSDAHYTTDDPLPSSPIIVPSQSPPASSPSPSRLQSQPQSQMLASSCSLPSHPHPSSLMSELTSDFFPITIDPDMDPSLLSPNPVDVVFNSALPDSTGMHIDIGVGSSSSGGAGEFIRGPSLLAPASTAGGNNNVSNSSSTGGMVSGNTAEDAALQERQRQMVEWERQKKESMKAGQRQDRLWIAWTSRRYRDLIDYYGGIGEVRSLLKAQIQRADASKCQLGSVSSCCDDDAQPASPMKQQQLELTPSQPQWSPQPSFEMYTPEADASFDDSMDMDIDMDLDDDEDDSDESLDVDDDSLGQVSPHFELPPSPFFAPVKSSSTSAMQTQLQSSSAPASPIPSRQVVHGTPPFLERRKAWGGDELMTLGMKSSVDLQQVRPLARRYGHPLQLQLSHQQQDSQSLTLYPPPNSNSGVGESSDHTFASSTSSSSSYSTMSMALDDPDLYGSSSNSGTDQENRLPASLQPPNFVTSDSYADPQILQAIIASFGTNGMDFNLGSAMGMGMSWNDGSSLGDLSGSAGGNGGSWSSSQGSTSDTSFPRSSQSTLHSALG